MQLDIFEHSRDTMLRNDVVAALESHAPAAARAAWHALGGEFAADAALPLLDVMVGALESRSDAPISDHEALRAARRVLSDTVEPAALRILGARDGAAWLVGLWRHLAQRAARLPYLRACGDDHAAPLWLRALDAPAAIDAVLGIESWRRIPTPLAWMTQARHLHGGLNSAWPLLAELAWLSPERFDRLTRALADPALDRCLRRFSAGFDGDATVDELAWFPAWLLTDEPGLAPLLGQAQRALWSPAEQGMRAVLELLGLEQQGRHHEIVQRRKALRDLSPPLFASYMATR